jgi:ubiquinone/menaquinone biosynthesis C-methylase UbiE
MPGGEFLVDDKTAEEFSSYMKKFPELYISLSHIVKNHSCTPDPFILDLGVGPGLLSIEILRQIPDATVIGLDPLIRMLRLARENVHQAQGTRFESVLGVSDKLPFNEKSIDTIVSRFSLPYWRHPNESFLEMHRVLKPGGRIIMQALNKEFPKWKLFCIKIRMIFNQAGRNVTNYHVDAYALAHTREEVEMFFKKSDFHVLKTEGKKNQWMFTIIAEKNIS